jgi:thiol:disulfide interchange protein DsbD
MKKFTLFLLALFLSFTGHAFATGLNGASANWFSSSNNTHVTTPAELSVTSYEHEHAITLIWDVPQDFYIYKDKIDVLLMNARDAKIGPLDLPKGEMKNDPKFGMQEVYHQQLSTEIKLYGNIPSNAYLEVRYQGCEGTICLPMQSTDIPITIQGMAINEYPTDIPANSLSTTVTEDINAESMTPIESSQSKNDYSGLWVLLGLGLLLSFTPCVLPMIPILTGLIIGQAKDRRIVAFFLSLSYVLGMAVTYALIGLLVSMLGASFQVALQTPIAIIISATIFIALSLSMFGIFNINLSNKHQHFLQKIQDTQIIGTYIGAFIMGVIATAILSPCTSAPLIGVLTHVAQSGDYLYGMLSLFTLAIGMGIPLILIGTGFGHFVPRTGAWMIHIKQLFGVIMLGMAIWVLSRIIPELATQVLFAALIIIYTVANGVLDKATNKLLNFLRAILILLFIYGISLLVGALMGQHNYFSPLQQSSPQFTTMMNQQIKPDTITVKSAKALEQQVATLQQSHSLILVDYYASWCASCHVLSRVIQSEAVQNHLTTKNIALIKADVSKYGADTTELLKFYNVLGMPTLVLINAQGKEIRRHSGELSSEELIQFLMPAK